VVAGQGRIDKEAGVVGADIHQQRARGDEALAIGQVDQLVQAGGHLHATVVEIAKAKSGPQVAVADDLRSLEALVAEGGPQGHGAPTAQAHHPQPVGIHKGQRAGEIGGCHPVRDVDGDGGLPQHGRVEVIEVAPVARAVLAAKVRLATIVALAATDPIDGVGDKPRLGHLAAIVIVVLDDLGLALGARVVAHDRILAELAMPMPAQERGALFPWPEVERDIHQQRGREVRLHIDDPALLAQAIMLPFGEELWVEGHAGRVIAQGAQDTRQGLGFPGCEILLWVGREVIEGNVFQGGLFEHLMRAEVTDGHARLPFTTCDSGYSTRSGDLRASQTIDGTSGV